MTPRCTLDALTALEAATGAPANRLSDLELMLPVTQLDRHRLNGHLAWMCRQAREFLMNGKTEKAHRWLGFVQGALYSTGAYSVHELQCMNSEYPDGK